MDRMFLHGIKVHGRHGVFEFERQRGQLFVIDVDWWIDIAKAVDCDNLDATVCYKLLYDLVIEVVAGPSLRLIETLSTKLVEKLLNHFPPITKLSVTIHKPNAPIDGPFADVGITIIRERPA